MGDQGTTNGRSPRCIALIGPSASGKTTLFEALLARTGATGHEGADIRKTIGDHSPEAQTHAMSVELNVASMEFLGDHFTLLDCPGSVEFQFDGMAALAACDAAIVVCEADDKKLYALQMVLKSLEATGIPHLLFINKIDKIYKTDLAGRGMAELLTMMQTASRLPLVLRQIPIWEDNAVCGFVDLALERAHVYREHAQSEAIEIPSDIATFEEEQRFKMLEKLTSTTVPVACSDGSSASSFIDRIGPTGMSSLLQISMTSNLVLVWVHCSIVLKICRSRGSRVGGVAKSGSVFHSGLPMRSQIAPHTGAWVMK